MKSLFIFELIIFILSLNNNNKKLLVLSQTDSPTLIPTIPTLIPTIPTPSPTNIPTLYPTKFPTPYPTNIPTLYPTKFPTPYPTKFPTPDPSPDPSPMPTLPTPFPTHLPTFGPSFRPTILPSYQPSTNPIKPTHKPSQSPSDIPTERPTNSPTTERPTPTPTEEPTNMPSNSPINPNSFPTIEPTGAGSTRSPTNNPISKNPTNSPSQVPTGDAAGSITDGDNGNDDSSGLSEGIIITIIVCVSMLIAVTIVSAFVYKYKTNQRQLGTRNEIQMEKIETVGSTTGGGTSNNTNFITDDVDPELIGVNLRNPNGSTYSTLTNNSHNGSINLAQTSINNNYRNNNNNNGLVRDDSRESNLDLYAEENQKGGAGGKDTAGYNGHKHGENDDHDGHGPEGDGNNNVTGADIFDKQQDQLEIDNGIVNDNINSGIHNEDNIQYVMKTKQSDVENIDQNDNNNIYAMPDTRNTSATSAMTGINTYTMIGGSAGGLAGMSPGGINENEFEQWTQKQVLMWIEKILNDNGFDKQSIDLFVQEFADKYITGKVLTQFKGSEDNIESLKNQFSKENQKFGMWLVIKTSLLSIGDS